MENARINKLVHGYLSVEASIILPIIFACIFFALFMLFFQYDKVLSKLDAGILGLQLKYNYENESCNDDRLCSIKYQNSAEKNNLYLFFDVEEFTGQKKGKKLVVNHKGKTKFPFAGFSVLSGISSDWLIETNYKLNEISPGRHLRNGRVIREKI